MSRSNWFYFIKITLTIFDHSLVWILLRLEAGSVAVATAAN